MLGTKFNFFKQDQCYTLYCIMHIANAQVFGVLSYVSLICARHLIAAVPQKFCFKKLIEDEF